MFHTYINPFMLRYLYLMYSHSHRGSFVSLCFLFLFFFLEYSETRFVGWVEW